MSEGGAGINPCHFIMAGGRFMPQVVKKREI